ncbi:MAG: stage III sporulation protein AF [Dorea sp.]|nr:stage III sporulation protein AF [Dorea sp.]
MSGRGRESDKAGRILAVFLAVFLTVSFSGLLAMVFAEARVEAQENLSSEAEPADSQGMGDLILGEFNYEDVDKALESMFPKEQMDFRDTVAAVINGEQGYSAKVLWQLISGQFTYAFSVSRENLIHILIIAVIAAVFHNFSTVFKSRQICEISFYILYLLLIALCLRSFQMVIDWVSAGIENLTGFMTVFCPIYFLAVSIAKGSVTAVAFYNLVLFFIYVIELVIVYFLLPVIHIYIMVKVLDFLSSQEYLSKFAELIEVAVSWLLKTLVACVVGLNVMQGMISPAIDTVKRSAVTRTAEAIPGVGDAVGGVAEVVLGTAVLVKNGIGTVGMVVCLALCIVPLVQMGAVALMYKLAAAVIQPVSDKRIVGCVECVGEGCRLLMRVVFTTGLLFLLTIVVVSFVTSSV